MKYRRYGKFRFSDYTSAWFAIVFLLILVGLCILTDTPFYLLICPLLLLSIMIWSIYKPNSESFLIFDDTITIIQGKKRHNISISSETTIIISYADICTPIAKYISYGNQTYILKNRYSISIIQKMPLETVYCLLHQKYTYRYTNTTIATHFGEHYVYSFVAEQELFDKFISNKKCHIIIPETLLNQISTNLDQMNVHIDVGY